jgi:hypothetical protein
MKLSKIYKAETYEKAEKLCPKGYRLPYLWELFKLLQEGKGKKILDYEKGEWRAFWTKKDELKPFCLRVLVRNGYSGLGAGGRDLVGSYAGGRVVFVKGEA